MAARASRKAAARAVSPFRPRAFLALDLGTSHLGCLIADAQGRVLASVARPWSFPPDPMGGSLARRLDPKATFQALSALCRQALAQAELPGEAVAAVACTAQREGCVFLDDAGRERYAGPNLDLRAAFEGMACDEEHGEELYRSTGHLPSLLFAPARLRWLQDHQPLDHAAVRTILGLGDWLAFKLTGERRSDYTAACELGLLDVASLTWSEAALRHWGIDRAILPPLGRAGQTLGAVTAKAARATGLAAGTPVALGCADTQAALLGLGVLAPGQGAVVAGWSIPVQRVGERPLIDSAGRTWSGVHPLAGRWVLESNAAEAGNSYRWAVDAFVGPGRYQDAEALAAAVPPGAGGAQALLGPPLFAAKDMGLGLGGLLFPVPLTAGDVTPGILLRATLESIGYTVRANLQQLEAIGGPVTELRLGGGLARSGLFTQVLAACLGRPLRVGSADASLLGAAALAAASVGAKRDLSAACRAMAGASRLVEPDAIWAAAYQDGFARWLAVAQGLRGLGEKVL